MEPILRAIGGAGAAWRLVALSLACALGAAAAVAQDNPADDPAPESEPAPTATEDDAEYAPPKYTAEQKRDWELKQRLKFSQAVKVERLSPADKETLTAGAQYYLYRMTMPEERENLHEIVRELLDKHINSRVTSEEARNFMNEEVVRLGAELLDQHPHVRRNVLILAASLSSDPRAEPPAPFLGATKLFLTVLNDQYQFPAEKLWAAKGLARIARSPQLAIADRSRIATDLVRALETPEAQAPENWPYRMRLVDALGESGLVYDVTRQPILIDALLKLIINPQENWIIRATAARAVTQLPYEPQDNVNVPLVAYEITRLGHQMAQARNQAVGASHWPYCFLNLYMAFHPQTAEQKQSKLGLLNQVTRPAYAQHQGVVQSAYQVVIPVVNSVVSTPNAPAIPQAQIQAMGNWLQNNVPADLKPTPASKDLNRSDPDPGPMVSNDTSPAVGSARPTTAALPVRASQTSTTIAE